MREVEISLNPESYSRARLGPANFTIPCPRHVPLPAGLLVRESNSARWFVARIEDGWLADGRQNIESTGAGPDRFVRTVWPPVASHGTFTESTS